MTELAASAPARRWVLPCSIAFAAALVLALQILTADVGLHMADEGFLWYGVQRTVAGEVPLRDFQAYDPGRYYWCALLAGPSGAGILAVRWAVALFAAAGLALSLLVASRFVRHPLALLACGLLLVPWMFPRHKLFEPAFLAAALWVGVRLVERPSVARHAAAGALAGFAGFFGRNLAAYSVVGLGLLVLYLFARRGASGRWKAALAFVAAVPLGYAPLLAMLAFVPGFTEGMARSLATIFQHGVNLPLAYPWPWRTHWNAVEGWGLWGAGALTAAYLLPWIALPLGLVELVRVRRDPGQRPVAVAATVLGAIGMHHVYVRSDAPHLAQCIGPILLLSLELCGALRSRALRPLGWCLLAAITALVALTANPHLSRFRPGAPGAPAWASVAGDRLRLPAAQAGYLESVQAVVAAEVPADSPLWIVNRATLYPVLGRVAPLWWLHFYFESPADEQRELVGELDRRRIDWVLVASDAGSDEKLSDTHPLLWTHLANAFDVVARERLPAGSTLFRRRR